MNVMCVSTRVFTGIVSIYASQLFMRDSMYRFAQSAIMLYVLLCDDIVIIMVDCIKAELKKKVCLTWAPSLAQYKNVMGK